MTGKVWSVLEDRLLELGPVPRKIEGAWDHWRLTRDDDGVAWLILDKKGAGTNTLSEGVLRELAAALETVGQDDSKALVIRSGKPNGFLAGADISEFGTLTEVSEAEARISQAHEVVDRLDRLGMTTIAVIHGFCLGGGLELALACDHRIAVSDARFGFPEVMLGLHPGLGGTFRSTRLIDPTEAMTMMLTGKTVDARKAKRLGLVGAVTEERHVRAAVKSAVAGELRVAAKGTLAGLLGTGPGRRFAARRMRAETEKKARREHYPAPYALIDLWERHGDDPKAMQKAEIESFTRLLVGETAQNLIRVFFLRERLKKLAGEGPKARHVHVIGAGAMGGDIAAWCAWQGLTVSLADMKPEPLAGAIKRATELYDRIGRQSTRTRDALDRLIPDMRGEGVRHADIVIEAVPERLEIKQKVFDSVEPRMKEGAILATNTSSIPLEKLRATLKRPGRLVGLHFFNPVSRMQLVEIVRHDGVDEDADAAARAFVGQIDRLPAPVKSAPGFLVNRALTPYLVEALAMLDEGVKKETIDAAAERFGMPMGPIELADQVGLDICLQVADVLRAGLDRPMPPAPDWLRKKVEAGELGKKSAKGLYDWKDGKAQKAKVDARPDLDLTDRLILPMLDVCVSCLREGIVEDEDVVDASMIFATGFAPFRGGPMHYARKRGVADIREAMERLAQRHGERFRPDPGWDRLS